MNLVSLCSKGDLNSALKLTSNGWNPNHPMSAYGLKDETPMHYACAYGNVDFVKVFIEVFAADPCAQTARSCEAPMHWACRHGNLDIIRYIAKISILGIYTRPLCSQTTARCLPIGKSRSCKVPC